MKMKDYLTLIRKSDFTDLFKFGYLFIDTKGVVEFDGNIETLRSNLEIEERIFNRPNQFDYSFTVLIMHFRCKSIESGKLNIEDVQHIFALDEDAKREIEISYDPRIRIDVPLWPDAPNKLQERFIYEDARKGALNIWSILKIEQPISEVKTILSDSDIKEIAYEVQNDKRPKGDLSFWVYLLRYERHGFFPKKTSGFFMDLINVFINTVQKQEFPAEAVETTEIYKVVSQNENLSMVDLINTLAETETGRNFFDKVDEACGGKVNSFVIALLYLILRNKFDNGFNLSQTETLNYSREKFPDEINYSLFLLGIYLGNAHTFECLYDSLPLPIFKPIVKVQLQAHQPPSDIDDEDNMPSSPQTDENNDNSKDNDAHQINTIGGLFGDQQYTTFPSEHERLPKYVRLPGTTGNKGRKKIKDEHQFKTLLAQGYVPDINVGYT